MPVHGAPANLLTNRSMPSATVIPELAYPDVRAAVAWLCRWFGFQERLRIGEHRAQLVLGDGAVIVVGLPLPYDGQAPPESRHAVTVRVDDVDAHYRHVEASGARTCGPPVDYPYGERQYSALDPGGHRWTFSQSVADVDPRDWGGEVGPG